MKSWNGSWWLALRALRSRKLPDRFYSQDCQIGSESKFVGLRLTNDDGIGVVDARTLKYRAKLDLLGAEDMFSGTPTVG